jgi:hypothetical protein
MRLPCGCKCNDTEWLVMCDACCDTFTRVHERAAQDYRIGRATIGPDGSRHHAVYQTAERDRKLQELDFS